MGSPSLDQNAPRFNGPPRQAPRGLVRPPAEITAFVTQERARLQPYYTEEYAKRALDDLTLAYYYEGTNVAYRSVVEGVEVLAVGDEEVGRFVQTTPPDQRREVHFKEP